MDLLPDDDQEPRDPRLQETDERGMPGELVDTSTNLPGDHDEPDDDDRAVEGN